MRGITVEVISGDLPAFLEMAANRGVQAKRIVRLDVVTAFMQVNSREADIMAQIALKRGDTCNLIRGIPINVFIRNALSRWVIILCSMLLLIVSLYIPTRVLFVRVDGNARVSTAQIALAVEKCGIYFGADRRTIRSVTVKNGLLELIPDIGWACINTSGCVATINVIEKLTSPQEESENIDFSGIYAVKDGIVQNITVYSGFAEVTPGQAVKAGQRLVTGSQQDGALIRKTRSSAEIFAVTTSDLDAVYMSEADNMVINGESTTHYSLIVGKKLVNFVKRSRICTHECDKIEKEIYLSLPGGFVLPVGIAVQSCICYHSTTDDECDQSNALMAERYMHQYISDNLVAGRVLRMEYLPHEVSCNNRISVRFYCYEMIGRERIEESDHSYGEND